VNTWKPLLAALVIFGAGVITGGFTVNLRRQPPAPRWTATGQEPTRPWLNARLAGQQGELFRRMERQLDLTAEQRQRIEAIVKESQGRIRALAEDLAPRTREELRRMREKLREELTPEQRRKFEKLDESLRQRESGPRRGERPGPPPPSETP
jgi:Spy/CpxP family protein refolding chaperone